MSDPTLKLIVLKTDQIESVRAFYAQLGFQFQQEQHGKGPVHYSAKLGEGILEVYPLPSNGSVDRAMRLGFGVTNVAMILETLDDLGEVVSREKQTPWGLRAVVRDPDGRTVELYQAT